MEPGKSVHSSGVSPSGLPYAQVLSRHAVAVPGSLVMPSDFGSTGTGEEPLSPETTIELLELAKDGDAQALDRLLERCVPALRRWAHGRLPQTARGMNDTADVVQDTIISAMRHLQAFESRHQGALGRTPPGGDEPHSRRHPYHNRRPAVGSLPESLRDEATSPLEAAIGAENLARYEAALLRLTPPIGSNHRPARDALSVRRAGDVWASRAAAARMAVTRAMKRLARRWEC